MGLFDFARKRSERGGGIPSQQTSTLDLAVPGRIPISECPHRTCVTVAGRVRTIEPREKSGIHMTVATLDDGSGQSLHVVWLGRRLLGGIEVGTLVAVTGTIGRDGVRWKMIDPNYQIVAENS